MGYTLLQIGQILAKADKTMYKIGNVAYDDMFSELDEKLDYERDIIYIYKKAVEYADDFYVGTVKLDTVVEKLASKVTVYDYGSLNPIYSDAVTSTSVLPFGAVLNDLADVTITNLQNNQILKYNSTLGQWVNTGTNAAIRSSQSFTAALNQTVFTTASPFDPTLLDVFLNGVRLNTSSYTTFGEYQITLADGCLADDIIDVIIYDPTSDIVNGDLFMTKAVYDTDNDGIVDDSEKITIIARNSTGSTIHKGKIVYLQGSTGNRPNMLLAQANSEATSSKTFGVVVEDVANNADGQVAAIGTLHDLDTRSNATNPFTTDTLLDGDLLWLSATNPGYVTRTPPTQPNHTVFIGVVARTTPSFGRIIYKIQNGFELQELHNVSISSPSDGQVLKYNATTGLWYNGTDSSSNIYNSDGTLTENRTITSNGFSLKILGGIQDITNEQIGLKLETSTNAMTAVIAELNNTFTTTGKKYQLRSLSDGAFDIIDRSASNTRLLIRTNGSMSLLSNNQIGTSPLTINGQTAISGGIQIQGGLSSPTGAGAEIEYSGGISYLSSYNRPSTWIPLVIRASQIDFTTNGTNTSRLFSTGNLTIGGTTDAGYKLDVQGTTRVTDKLYIRGNGLSTSGDDTFNLIAYGHTRMKLKNVSGGGGQLDFTWEGNAYTTVSSAAHIVICSVNTASFGAGSGSQTFIGYNGLTDVVTPVAVGKYAWQGINASAILEVASTTKGFLPPRMTTTQRDAIVSPATGLSVYNTTINTSDFYNGTSWVSLAAGNIYTADGTLTGNRTVSTSSNNLTFTGSNFFNVKFGSTTYSNQFVWLGANVIPSIQGHDSTFSTVRDLALQPNGGKVGVGNNAPSELLEVTGTILQKKNDASGVILKLNNTSTSGKEYWLLSTGSGNTPGAGTLSIYDNTSAAYRLVLTSSGRLLLGTTTESTFLLDVNGTGRFTNDLAITSIVGNSIVSSATSYFLNVSNSSGVVLAQFNNNGTSAKILDGNVQFTTGTTINSVSHASVIIGVSHIYGSTGGANGGQYFAAVDNAANSTRYMVGHGSKGLKVELSPTATWETSALLQVSSTTQGFLPPRMTSAQRAAISTPATGLIVYQTDGTEGLYERTSTAWRIINASGGGSGITRSVNNISTTTTAGAAANTDYVYLISGTTTLTLPTAAGNTNRYTLKNVGTNTVTINTTSSQTIDGSTSITMSVRYTALDVISDGTNWNII